MQEMQETWVRSLASEDPLEKKMATHSSILAWEIPWAEEPGRLQSIWGHKADVVEVVGETIDERAVQTLHIDVLSQE